MSKQSFVKKYECVSEASRQSAAVTARKARLILDIIRGKSVEQALNLLTFTYKPSACPMIIDLIKSAAANAEVKGIENAGELIITGAFADHAGMLKRLRPAPMGRGVRVRKRSSHITIRLEKA